MGNPASVHDLIRVNAHKATSIMVMMTEQDNKETEDSNGKVTNGATLRTVLAMRHVLYSNNNAQSHLESDLRIVVQLQTQCPFAEAAAFKSPNKDRLV